MDSETKFTVHIPVALLMHVALSVYVMDMENEAYTAYSIEYIIRLLREIFDHSYHDKPFHGV